MNKRKFLALGLSSLLVAALVLVSCGPAPVVEEPVVVEPVVEEPVVEEITLLGFPRRETLFVNLLTARVGSPGNFNKWAGWRQRDQGMQQVMNEAMWQEDVIQGVIVNALAAGPPSYNEDMTEATFYLREGVYWSDGVERTADDVVFTVKLAVAVEGLDYHTQMQKVERVYAADKYTVVFELTEPDPKFHLRSFQDHWGSFWTMPKQVFGQFVTDPDAAVFSADQIEVDALFAFDYNPPLSNGPYVLHSYSEEGAWTAWVKRDDWERTPTGMLYGEPKPKYVVWVAVETDTARVIMQTRHELDFADLGLPAIRAALDASPYIQSWFAERGFPWLLSVQDPVGASGASFNTLKPPFDNVDVRWALTLAIDALSYSETSYDGATGLNPFYMPNFDFFVEPYIEPLIEWLENDFTIEIEPGVYFKPYDSTVPFRLVDAGADRGFDFPDDPDFIKANFGWGWWKYAPDVAARLLEKHGFTRDDDGMWLLPDGTKWKFSIITGQTPVRWGYRNALALQVEWRKFGIDVTFQLSELASTMIPLGDFDVIADASGGSFLHFLDIDVSFATWHPDLREPELGERTWGHVSRWSDPRLGEILDELGLLIAAENMDLFKERILEFNQILIINMPQTQGTGTLDPYTQDNYYWTNWPSAENPYTNPMGHFPTWKYLLPFLEATGR